MGVVEDLAGGVLVDAPALHAHQTVLHQVGDAHAVLGADLIQLFDDLHGAVFDAVDCHGHALFVVHGDVFRLVRGVLGGIADQAQILGRLVPGILQLRALVGQMPQVPVHAVGPLLGHGHVQAPGHGVVDLLFPGLDVPDPPGGDNLHVGSQGLDGQFKAHLVVALAGGAVANGGGAFLLGDLHQPLGDDGPGKAGAQEVLLLVYGVHLQGGPNEVGDELLPHVLDVDLGRAGLDGLFVEGRQLLSLAHVHRHSDDLAVVVFLQPGDDDRGIQTAGIGENNFFFHV